MAGFDRRITAHAQAHGCIYTRYADDLTFSSKELTASELRSVFENEVEHKLYGFGFKAKKEKTRFKDRGRFQSCGIVVNVKPNIARYKVMKFRAMVHHATVKHADKTTPSHLRKLRGWCSFLKSVNPTMGDKYMAKLDKYELATIN